MTIPEVWQTGTFCKDLFLNSVLLGETNQKVYDWPSGVRVLRGVEEGGHGHHGPHRPQLHDVRQEDQREAAGRDREEAEEGEADHQP